MEQIDERNSINALTSQVLACAFRVSNELGSGFLEKVYENALAIELQDAELAVEQQHRVQVKYKGRAVGDYVADLIVDQRVVVEVKAIRSLDNHHEAQALNYLRSTGLKVALLLNFGRARIEYRRVVWGF